MKPSASERRTRDRFPLPGQRIIRSVIVVWLTFAIYLLRAKQGIPIFTAIAGLQCIQPDPRDIRALAWERIRGTLIGSFWGLLFLYMERFIVDGRVTDGPLHYLFVGLFTGAVLYFTVVLRATDVAFFSAITFLAIAIDHVTDLDLLGHALVRTFDTLAGIVLGTLVNQIRLPRRKNTDILFATGCGEFFIGPDRELSPFSKVELNRLIRDGAKITISTMQTQATVRELFAGVDLRYPVVTMDGAALYDLNQLTYLKTNPMPEENAARIMRWLDAHDLPYFSNSIEENLLVIRYAALANDAMREIYESHRRSPYRNYLKGVSESPGHVVYILVVAETDKINVAYDTLLREEWASCYRIALMPDDAEIEGYTGLKIYDRNTSQAAMLRELEKLLGTKQTVTFGFDPARYDVTVGNRDRNLVVKEIRDRFEPVDFRYWRNIFRM